MQTLVNNELLKAADRLYDVVDDILNALALSPCHRLLALDGLAHRARIAKSRYDDAMAREPAEVSSDASQR